MSSQHFIVLNGKRYDAVTGAFLGAHAELPAAHKAASRSEHTPAKAVHAPRTAAGHTRHATHTQHQQHATASALKEAHQAAHAATHQTKKSREHHGQPQHLKAHKPQTAKTLMRRVVHKPEEANKTTIKQQYPVKKTESGVSVEAPKRLAHTVDTNRQARAQQVHQSHHVGRYQASALKPIAPKVAQVAVAEEPKQHPKQHHTTKQPQHHKTAEVLHAQPHPKHTVKQQPAQPKATKIDVFEQALADAKSHKEKSPKARNRGRRWLSATAAVASVLILGGFVAFLNRSAIELQLASVQAGFAAAMPAYAPEGFERQNTTAHDGTIAINFTSPFNERYTVSQEESNWDSQTLFDSLIAKPDVSYQVVQNSGRNIYIYDNSKAAWVDGGVLYKISGNAKLDSDQLISIASSI